MTALLTSPQVNLALLSQHPANRAAPCIDGAPTVHCSLLLWSLCQPLATVESLPRGMSTLKSHACNSCVVNLSFTCKVRHRRQHAVSPSLLGSCRQASASPLTSSVLPSPDALAQYRYSPWMAVDSRQYSQHNQPLPWPGRPPLPSAPGGRRCRHLARPLAWERQRSFRATGAHTSSWSRGMDAALLLQADFPFGFLPVLRVPPPCYPPERGAARH